MGCDRGFFVCNWPIFLAGLLSVIVGFVAAFTTCYVCLARRMSRKVQHDVVQLDTAPSTPSASSSSLLKKDTQFVDTINSSSNFSSHPVLPADPLLTPVPDSKKLMRATRKAVTVSPLHQALLLPSLSPSLDNIAATQQYGNTPLPPSPPPPPPPPLVSPAISTLHSPKGIIFFSLSMTKTFLVLH